MYEIRFHGRGGQGAVLATRVLAKALVQEEKFIKGVPSFGFERRGAPVQAFVRFDNKKIRLRSQIYEPDYIIVQDSSLIRDVNVFQGLKEGGIAIINTEKALTYPFPKGVKVITIDATSIALKTLGVPITNTTLMGAFAAASGEIKLEALEDAVRRRFSGELAEKNIAAAEEAYRFVKEAS